MRFPVVVALVGFAAGCSLFVDTSGFSGDTVDSADASAGDARTGTDATPDAGGPPADSGSDAAAFLVGDWPFDEGTGGTVADKSGRAHHAVAFGGAWVADRTDAAASAFGLDGIASYLSVAADPDFDRGSDAKLTISAWARVDETPNHEMLVSVSYGTKDAAYGLELESPTIVTYFDGDSHVAEATIPNPVGAWHHYGVVIDGSQARVYFDGARVAQGTANITRRTATQVLFGHSTWGDYTKGAIDAVRFYRAALTDAEMLAEKNR